uniref:DNA 3'-5' helicase n=1 Tax=candidate division WOR-3 bacterium TaxID=2052148 RepID=A0A7C4TCT5_UNCW3
MDKIKNIALISAAGSGKTHALTKRFLLLFLHKNNYPLESIYAITFTNAAAFEMKIRILRYLDVLSTGVATKEQEKDVWEYFCKIFSENEIREIARKKRDYLLNNLSSLNVSTFHSMFASFLSVIPFEAGILPEYRIVDEIKEKMLLEEAIEKYLLRARQDRKSAEILLEHISLEEEMAKKSLSKYYEQFKPYIGNLKELSEEKEIWTEKTSQYEIEVIDALREFINFIRRNIEATYTEKGEIHYHWKGFLKKVEEFIAERKYEKLKPLLEYFIKEDGGDKKYINDFRERLDDPQEYERKVSLIRKMIIEYLGALSNKEIIINFRPFIEIYEIFQEEKRKKNIITFSDIEDCIFYAFKNNPEVDYLYFKLGAEIKHLMIDEFQDTSYKQIDILFPILDEITSYNPEEKSLFYVGDPHQAIFRWREGAPELFDELKEKYKEKITEERLEKNYRTKVEIIDFVNKILNKDDKPDPKNKRGWLRIEELGEFLSEEGKEVIMNRVVEIIKELKKNGYQERDIAILTRTNKFASQIAGLLSKNNIPSLSRSRASIMDEPDVQFIIQLLKFLDNPEDDFSLFHILTSEVFNLDEEFIRGLKKRKTLYLSLKDFYPELYPTKKIEELLSRVYFLNPYQIIFNICKSLNLKISYPIASLLDSAIDYMEDGFGSLSDFIKYLEHYGTAIEVKEAQIEGVRIMTIHRAKGLEFEVVILPETNFNLREEDRDLIFSYTDKARPEKIYLREYGKYLPGLKEKERELQMIDELNLLYVALTRAKTGIYMLGFKRKKGNAGFWMETIKERLNGKSLPFDEITVKESPVVEKEPERLYSLKGEEELLVREERELVSPTERGIEIIEPSRRRGMRFGDFVHKALSQIEWLDGLNIDETIEGIVDFVKRTYCKDEDEVREVEKRLKEILKETLTDPDLHLLFYRDGQNRTCKNELNLYYERGNADVSAHLDRVIFEAERITIIDYKMGREKEDYHTQLMMYKQGVQKIYPKYEVFTYLLYLEAERGRKLRPEI